VLSANSPTIRNLPPQINTTFKKFVDDGPTVTLKKRLDDPRPVKKMVDEPPPNFKKLRDDVIPKRKIVDDPGGIKKVADEGPKLKLADDQLAPPAESAEQPKHAVTDFIHPKLKIVDDNTLAYVKHVIDHYVVVRPPIPTPGILLNLARQVTDDPKLMQKWLEDEKRFADQKNHDDNPVFKGPEDPIPPNKVFGPDNRSVGPASPGEATPFILSTPHHATLGVTSEAQVAANREAQLAEIEAAIQQVAQQYQELAALYQALTGGQ
jgi:hypothetical protein